MKATAGLQMPAPSRNLLRFLRAQSETAGFLSSTPASSISCLRPASPNALFCHTSIARRPLSTTRPQQSKVRLSYLDDLWDRHRDSSARALPPPSPHNHSLRRTAPQPQARHVSTESPDSWYRRLLHGRRRAAAKLQPDDLPFDDSHSPYDDTSGQLFNLSRSVRASSSPDLKLRCTEFDASGSVTLVSGEFKKSELVAKYGLLPRDLRKIDSSSLPHILVRPSAILLNLLHLRVLIQSDRVLVFDAYGSTDSYTQSLFMYDLEGRLRQKADPRASINGTYLPYEFRALEAVLTSVTSGLESEFEGVREPVVRVLRELEEDIDREKLRLLLIHSKKLGTFEQKARLVRDAINDLLDADDDLAAMYLTERAITGKKREEVDHQEVEMLLESYHKICDEIVEISGNLIGNIRSTEEVIKAILDANRNSLMLLEIKFSIGTLGLAAGTLVAGLYGMNLKNFIEESEAAFAGVSIVCFGLTGLCCLYGLTKLRRVQRVRMWGEGYGMYGGASQRGNWRHEAMEHAGQSIATQSRIERARRLKAERGPVLWPGMDGLGMHNLPSPPPCVTVVEDVIMPEGKVGKNSAAEVSKEGMKTKASMKHPQHPAPPTPPAVPASTLPVPTAGKGEKGGKKP